MKEAKHKHDLSGIGQIVLALIVMLYAAQEVAHAQGCFPEELGKLLPDEVVAGSEFGTAISISGDIAVIGAPYEHSDMKKGTAHVFSWDGTKWIREAQLIPSAGQDGDRTGCSVSVSGDVAVIGAEYGDGSSMFSGAAYVFRRVGGEWIEEAILAASDGESGDFFGSSASISGDVILIGAPSDEDWGDWSGSAYVFRYDGAEWIEEAKLSAFEGDPYDNFGTSVSVSGDVAVIGAFQDDDIAEDAGCAYAFRWDGVDWSLEDKLYTFTGDTGDWFGYSVSVDGDIAVIGAPNADGLALNSGLAYVFRWTGMTWAEQDTLFASDGAINEAFGEAVSVSGGVAVVGNEEWGDNNGAAYVFRWDGVGWPEEIDINRGISGDFYGSSVVVSGDRLLIAERGDDNTGEDSGAVWAYDWDGSGWNYRGELFPAAASDAYAWDVSVNDETAIVGAWGDSTLGTQAGAAFVFHREGGEWIRQETMFASDSTSSAFFGYSVSHSGDVAAIGAYGKGDTGLMSGAAYVFRRDSSDKWIEEQKLLAPDGAANDFYGYSAAVDGDVLVIGAPYYDPPGMDNTGAAFVYRWDGIEWVEEKMLIAADGQPYDFFGGSVAISGNVIVVGALFSNDFGEDSGSAYVYRWNGTDWIEEKKLLVPGGDGDWFGYDVSISEDLILVGAPLSDGRGIDAGSAYVFRWMAGDWREERELVPLDYDNDDQFGRSVSIEDRVAIVGSPKHDDGVLGEDAGAAFVFHFVAGTIWTQEAELTAADGWSGDYFGWSIDLSGNQALIGAPNDDDLGPTSGSAYSFELNCGPELVSLGSCPGRMRFRVTGVTPSGLVAFLRSFNTGSAVIPPGKACAGTSLELAMPVQVIDAVEADDGGVAYIVISHVPSFACGRMYLQVLDTTSCETSNVVLIE